MSTYRFNIEVREKNTYGDRIIQQTTVSVLAADVGEVTTKVRAMFNATFDDFRKFWSHDWTLNSVTEESPVPASTTGSEQP